MDIDNDIIELMNNGIINDFQLKRLLGLEHYMNAYELIKRYAVKYSYDYKLSYDIINKLFIYYLEEKSMNSDNIYLFENVLGSMCGYLEEDVLEYLLGQNIIINHMVNDRFNNEVALIDLLAVRIKSSKIMNLFLDKIKNTNKKCFSYPYLGKYTDLCIMNIIAGKLDTALGYFNEEEYKLGIDAGINYDNLYKILKTVKSYYQKYGKDVKRFVTGIIYSKKIKLFYIDNLLMIKDILSDEDYNKFISYLSSMVFANYITLFSINEEDNTMCYETIDSIFRDNDGKYLKRIKKIKDNS